ncbi:MAG: hypothetical protein JEZ06_16040 [Anaerolineaceae bacterium]|nr:hypothetical protein [Anaerolineaceae bacterium]
MDKAIEKSPNVSDIKWGAYATAEGCCKKPGKTAKSTPIKVVVDNCFGQII